MSGSLPGTSPAATVVQQFKAPTRDRHPETQMARVAAESEFLG